VDNWTTTVDVRYGQSSTREGFDHNAQRTSALDIFGHTNVVRLGFGLEGLAGASMANTGAQWVQGYDQRGPLSTIVPPPAFGPLDVANENLIKLNGRVSSSEVAVNIEQNLFSGFFAQCYMPFRQLTIDNLGYEVVGNSVMPGGGTVANFVDTLLPAIMREQGMESLLTSYKKQAVADVVLGLGWQGSNDQGFSVIDDATGRVFIGAIIPAGGKADKSYAVGLPLGYDGFWGVHSRMELEVSLKKVLAIGVASSINIFFQDTRTTRVMSDFEKKQSGILSFAQARARVDQGPVWDVNAFARLQKVFYGLTAQVGYSFTRQEDTSLRIDDVDYLKTAGVNFANLTPPQFLNRDDVANADQRLRAWERQLLHFCIGYDFRLHENQPKFVPAIAFECAFPVDGRRVMTGKMFGGTASLQMKMLF
jgi:hypothetical protein